MKNPRWILPVVVLLVLVTALYLGTRRARPQEGFYSGVVETTTYDLAFEVPGRIASFAFEEGQVAPAGAPLVRLVETDLKTALEAARAREGVAAAQLSALEAGSRPEEIQGAQARLERARAELERQQNGATSEELDQARGQSESARENYLLRKQGYRSEDIEAAQAKVAATRSTLERAQADADRWKFLYGQGAVPARDREAYENRLVVARTEHDAAVQAWQKLARGYQPEEIEAARQQYLALEARYRELRRGTRSEVVQAAQAEVAAAQSSYALVREGPRAEDIQAARRRLQEARAAVEQASLNLAKAVLKAPAEGLILTRNYEVGEMVQPGQPVLTLADLQKPWVEIFVPEPEIGQVHPGDAYDVTVDSAPGRVFPGRVTRIYEQAEFTPKTIQTQTQRVNLVFRVKVTVEKSAGVLKPGMPADARRVADRAPEPAGSPASVGPPEAAGSPRGH